MKISKRTQRIIDLDLDLQQMTAFALTGDIITHLFYILHPHAYGLNDERGIHHISVEDLETTMNVLNNLALNSKFIIEEDEENINEESDDEND